MESGRITSPGCLHGDLLDKLLDFPWIEVKIDQPAGFFEHFVDLLLPHRIGTKQSLLLLRQLAGKDFSGFELQKLVSQSDGLVPVSVGNAGTEARDEHTPQGDEIHQLVLDAHAVSLGPKQGIIVRNGEFSELI